MHKHIESHRINMINYMSTFTNNFEFLGFIPIQSDYSEWGCLIDGQYYCAVHLSKTEINDIRADDIVQKEQNLIDSGYVWVMCFYGSDNMSYMVRFKTRSKALNWLNKAKFFNQYDENLTVLFYNS